ncbi:hypothetical protein Tco_0774507 [Tanacetum coccineum]|uniref:Uncharacterized protein n=1 Tax=Tanacetum coccineum TaxID=301880 RepID=A0ABQ4ZQW3_9ASTR
MPQDQGDDMGNTEDQPNVEEASKHDWFKKPERPPTPDHDWNAGKQIDFRPPQTWISKMAKAGKPPTTFDELMSTLIEFSAYVLHNLKKCYKDGTDKLDWTNPEGHEYPFDLIKPLPLIKDQGRQVVPANYFFNNDLEYLKDGSLSSKYTASTTKTKAAKYDTIEGIEDMGDYVVTGDDYEGPPVFDDDQYEEESVPVYDTDIEDVIEEEEGFVGKGGIGGEEDNIEDIVVVANDLCSSMIQTTLNVDFEEDINTKSHELMSFGKSILIKFAKILNNRYSFESTIVGVCLIIGILLN